jgi:transcriptional regulator with XRE-family HTH domain
MKQIVNSFGATVRQLRETRNWSQEALAERADLNRSYVGEIERGQVIVSLVTVHKLATALGVPTADLMRASESPEKSFQS